MTCEACGCHEGRVRYAKRSYGRGSDLLVIENVPVVSCPRCGENYMTADTMDELDRIKPNRSSLAKPRSVPVATCWVGLP